MAAVGLELLRRHKITERERALTERKGVQKSDCNADREGENKLESDRETDEKGDSGVQLHLEANDRRKIILSGGYLSLFLFDTVCVLNNLDKVNLDEINCSDVKRAQDIAYVSYFKSYVEKLKENLLTFS